MARAARLFPGRATGAAQVRDRVIADLVPAQVAVVEKFDDSPAEELFDEERALVDKAVATRRTEFATGRGCARRALSELGFAPTPILSGHSREPLWPEGVIGSITHCAGYRAAAVARLTEVQTIGIDAEPHEPMPDGLIDIIALADERAHLAALSAADRGTRWDRLLFSAKESVYKAWFPLTGRWLGFEDALITFAPDKKTFTARILVDGSTIDGGVCTGFTGAWCVGRGLVVAAISVTAPRGRS
jgi:4'-phosphopantetheinyl transferase EntD